MKNSLLFLIKVTIISLLLGLISWIPIFLMPIWILLFFSYWLLAFNIKKPAIYALFIGLLFDILQGELLGQNSLALILASLFILRARQSFYFSHTSTEQVYLFGASIIYLLSLYLSHAIYISAWYFDWYLLGITVTTPLCWLLVKPLSNVLNSSKSR